MSHCTALEQQISWNQTGQTGPAGPQGLKGDTGATGAPGKDGTNGTNGIDGVSPTVAQLSAGDSNCPNGGAAITDAAGHTAYACNGQDGTNWSPFSGTFTSPSGQFTLSVTDGGIKIVGPGTSISLDTSGNLTETVSGNNTITVGANRTENVTGDDTVTVSSNRTEKVLGNDNVLITGNRTDNVTGNDNVTITGNRTDKVTGAFDLQAALDLNLSAGFLRLNSSGACKPVARVGDLVDPTSLLIAQGSPDVCID